ncbi:MAG TPA: hypothetical protein VNS49_11895 [Streptomyces sp.]|nr:hypothetical protein [Streptomyces sp.]
MQRRARTYITGVALVVMLSGGLTACTGSPDEENGEDTKAGNSSASESSAPPGKYRTLPEPCGAVDVGTLKELLPGAQAAEDGGDDSGDSPGKSSEGSAAASPYEGEPIATYDTDRRAGCRWKSTNSLATRHLAVDFERVVSYDPAVSDDEQAQLLYDERAGQAEIPTESSPPPDDNGGGTGETGESDNGGAGDEGNGSEEQGEGQSENGEGDKSDTGESDGKGGGDSTPGSEKSDSADSSDGDDGSASPDPEKSKSDPSNSPDVDLSPRTLEEIGDNAYIDDQLDTGDSGVHRDITLVFRSANVIATVKYDQWLTDKRRTPDSAELQKKAQKVAEKLAAGFDDN